MGIIALFLPNRGFFGASLVVAPLLLGIRRRFPHHRLLGLSPAPMHDCIRAWGLIDEFVPYEKPLSRGFTGPLRRTWRERYDLVVNMRPGSEWVQLWSWSLRARERWAFSQGLGRFQATHAAGFDVQRYKAFNYLDLDPTWHTTVDGDLLAGWPGVQQHAPSRTLVLLPSGSDDRKLWPLEGYAAIARAWMQGMGDAVAILAGPREKPVIDWFQTSGLAAIPNIRLETGTPLTTQIQLIRSAAAVVHNDCGPGHLAQLIDRPRVVLFPDWGEPREWFRPGPQAAVLQAAPGHPIASISVESVLDAVRRISSG